MPRGLQRFVRATLTALFMGASVLCAPTAAGQAGSSFTLSIEFTPANASCTAGVTDDGKPQVNCLPGVGAAGAAPSGGTGAVSSALGYRLPDSRMKLAGAVVELGEENFQAWGEYSSRMIVAGGVEYVEMTVTW